MKKVILDLCGGSGAWSKPYKDAGYDVKIATLPTFDVYTWQGTWLSALVFENKVYGILAAPPCTMFSLARQNAKTPRNFNQGMRIVRACLQIIWTCRANRNSKLKFWCLENPTGYLRQFLGKPAFAFQPYDFGDNSKKRTDLWGYFKEPKKKPISKPTYPRKGISSWQGRNSARRSITPQGFAQAFFKANK